MTRTDWHTIVLVAHLVGLALGAGGATLTDVIFVTSVRKGRVGHTLESIMETSSSVVLGGYLLLLVSGGGLFLTGSSTSPRFWAKMVMVGVVGVNGLVAHRVTFPQLSSKMRSRSPDVTIGFLHQISGTAAISAVSWYGAIIAGTWKTSPWPFYLWVLVYFVVLAVATAVALIVTPHVLRVDHPDFDTMFPTLASNARRAAMMRRPHADT